MHTKFWWKTRRKRSLGKPRHRWKDNIRMDLREIGWEGEDWMHLAQHWDQWRDPVNTVMSLPFS
jgi:hypothetical protein